ncbi:hypothetical protein NIA69_22820 [Gemmiger formicilis]|nr:hypothetical protein [Gemmiger formicilis]
MVIVVGPAETAESVRELNFRHEFEIEEIHGSGVSTVLHQLEQGAEHITHLVYDVRIIGNIDASLALLDRLCKTIPGISEKQSLSPRTWVKTALSCGTSANWSRRITSYKTPLQN